MLPNLHRVGSTVSTDRNPIEIGLGRWLPAKLMDLASNPTKCRCTPYGLCNLCGRIVAGTQMRLKDALVRLQTTQTLASSCGTQGSSLSQNTGGLYFLDAKWDDACRIQKQLIFHYQMRAMRDRRRVAMLLAMCLCARSRKTSDGIWKVEIQDLDKAFVHVQYWWWMLQLLKPTNSTEEIKEYWAKSQKVVEPRIWDISLFRVCLQCV